MKMFLSVLTIAAILAGCAFRPLKPGIGVIRLPSGIASVVQQSENPQTESSQKYEKTADGAERVETHIGAAQKDTAREMAAKLSSLKGVVWIGVLVFLFGAASLFYPPLKLIVGSTTTSIMAIVAGLALIVLPSLIVGNEILILAGGLGAVVLYWWAHRHGSIHAELKTLKK
jgi:hypothetical protein